MTQKEINTEIIYSLKDCGRNMYSLVEEISYENQIDSLLVGGIIEKMIKQGWLTRRGDQVNLRFPYRSY